MNKNFRWGLVLSALVFAAVLLLSAGGSMPAQVARAQKPEGSTVVAWDTDGNKGTNKSFIGTTNNKPLVLKANNTEKMRILPTGWIGIGTSSPAVALHMLGNNSRVRLQSVQDDTWTALEYKTSSRQWDTGVGGKVVFNDVKDKYYIHDATADATRLVITPEGRVGINTTSPGNTLEIRGDLMVKTPAGEHTLWAKSDKTVLIGQLAPSTTNHICYNTYNLGLYTFSSCSSAAEYVPSIDGGKGFPETADLVSIAPDINNPYGDTHGPFTVQKSPKACDPNLLGYIVKPESGADGVNLNEHYLPLAIYGYFPAKVTLENGPIKRGDPITSSSKAGYGMKATDACKVIGYALEDAVTEGTIQVFANFGDNSAAQVQALRQENDALKKQLLTFEARLTALEGTAGTQTVALR